MKNTRWLGPLVALGLVVGGMALWRSEPAAPVKAPLEPPALEDSDGGPEVPEELSRAAFVQSALKTLRESGKSGPWRFDAEQFALVEQTADSGPGQILFLHNVYKEYQALPAARKQEAFQRLLVVERPPEMPKDFAEAKAGLMPVIRPRSMFEFLGLMPGQAKAAMESAAWRPLGPVLAVAVAYDQPRTMQYIGEKTLADWGMTFEQVLAPAMENLRQRSQAPLEEVAPGMCESTWNNDGYGSSRILLPEVVKGCKVKGEPVVMVPHRNLLVVAGSLDEDAQERMAERGNSAMQGPGGLDGRVLRHNGKDWELFLPERLALSHTHLKLLATLSAESDYEQQRALLSRRYEQEKVDLFIAPYTPLQDERDRVATHALWMKGVDTLLPPVDFLHLVDPAQGDPRKGEEVKPLAVVPWEQVMKEASKLLKKREDLYPVRYQTLGFPDGALLKRWKERYGLTRSEP